METKITRSQIIKKRALKGLLFLFASIIILAGILIGLLHLPLVQTKLTNTLGEYVYSKTGYDLSVQAIDIGWYDEAILEGITIKGLDGENFISAKSASLEFSISGLRNPDMPTLDGLRLHEPSVDLRWNYEKEILNMTLFTKTLRETFAGKKKSQKKKIKPFLINEIEITNGTLTYHMDHRPYMTDSLRFDHNHFELDSISGHLTDFYLYRDTIAVNGQGITLFENKTNLHIEELTTNFLYCKHAMEFDSVTLKTQESLITDFVRFEANNYSDYTNFVDSINLVLNLDSTVISTNELALFAPPIRKFNDTWTFWTSGRGFVRDFDLQNLTFSFGNGSSLQSSRLALDGLPQLLETEIKIDVRDAHLLSRDLTQYLPESNSTRTLKKLGNIHFSGDFRGFPLDFVAHGTFQTSLGGLKTDLRFYPSPTDSVQHYDGQLTTTNFRLGEFINKRNVGSIDMNGHIEGQGFKLNNANLLVTADVHRLEYEGYPYQNIKFDTAQLSNGFFKGGVNIQDPELQVRLLGKVDFNNQRIRIKSNISSANLSRLGLTKDSINVDGFVECDIQGFHLDSLAGLISVKNGHIGNGSNHYNFDHFDLKTTHEELQRSLSLKSSIADVEMKGQFSFEPLINDLSKLYREHSMALINDEEQLNQYYDSIPIDSNYHCSLTFNGTTKNINPFLNIVAPGLKLSPNTELKGTFSIDSSQSNLFITGSGPEVEYQGILSTDLDFNFESSKSNFSNNLTSQFNAKCSEIKRDGQHLVDTTIFNGMWDSDSLNFLAETNRRNKKEGIYLQGAAHFLPDTVLINLHDSKAKILDKVWTINESNLITYTKNSLRLQQLDLTTRNEKIKAYGILDKTNGHGLHLGLENFKLKNIQDFVPIPLEGSVTGESVLSMGSHGDLLLQSTASIRGIKVYDETIGGMKGKFIWDEYQDKLILETNYFVNKTKTARLEGYYDLKHKASPMHFKAKFKDTPASILEPFFLGYATNISGSGTGVLDIEGTFKDPDFQGNIQMTETAFTIDYLKTRYSFDGPIHFEDDWIGVKSLTLVDSIWQSTATLNGGITHKMFKKFNTDLDIDLDNTFILNTGPEDNSLYYGQAFGSGSVQVNGPFKEIRITSDQLTSNKNTKIHIPLEGTETIVEKDYIQFVDPRKNNTEKNNDSKLDLSGIVMDINLDVTPDAYMEIIFDEKAGDIMRGYGSGQLQLQIDTRGDFNMLGQYQIDKGTYNFTLVNLINKKFEIDKNSSITWSGDPYKGILDINARYKQYASIIPIVDTSIYDLSSRTEFYRNYPVEISLLLENELLKPEVSFNVEIQEYPASIEDVVESFHSRLSSDEQEKNKQVFTLVVLKQLSSPGSFGDLESGSFSSLSELFSNQFSHWLSQFDENLEVDIDLSGFDETNNANFNLRLSYSVLDGRIRITQNNDFQNMDNPSNLTNVFGEWTIEYLITDDGELKLKAYNKSDQSNVINDLNNNASTIYGASLTHTANFDNLGDLFRRNPNKYEIIEDDEETDQEEDKEDSSEDSTDDEVNEIKKEEEE